MNVELLIKRLRCFSVNAVLLPLVTTVFFWPTVATADNPIVSHVYTADPAARVFNDRVYVIVTHDQDNQDGYGGLIDYYLFSSDDMVNWQDHGIVWNSRTDSTWANLAYAPDFIERNGRYYLYFPDGAGSIGVAVASRPEGPYSDPLGRPLVSRSTPNANVEWLFDPGVFIDDDGQAYLYFGGGGPGNARVIRLNSDMTSTSGSAITLDVPNFFEALYMHKRDGTYYLSYSTDSSAGLAIDYMTSRNPTAGFSHRGTLLANPWENNNNNNHQSIIEYQGQPYIFYHNRAVANARGDSTYSRSINVDRLNYSGDSIVQVNAGRAGVAQLKYVDAFVKNEAEMFDNESGIETEPASEGSLNLMMDSGDWIKVTGVDFGSGATEFNARVAAEGSSSIEIRLDGLNNAPLASLQISSTGGWQTYATQSVSFSRVTGVHDVYLRSTGYHNVNWYQFIGGATTSSSSSLADSSASSASSISSTGTRVCMDMCQWYQDEPRPLCSNQTTGWGWENNQSCIGADTCNDQWGDGGVIQVCTGTSAAPSSTPESSSSSSSSLNNGSTIVVRMGGVVGDENVSLQIGGTTIDTWTLTTSLQDYSVVTRAQGEIRVAFINDSGDRDVQVDYISVNGAIYQAEDSQDNTGAWGNDECGGGSLTEMLHCNGSIGFGAIGSAGSSASSSTSADADIPPFFVGNITTSGGVRSDFTQYWDQITPENEGKWGSVESTRDNYNWGGLDAAYNYAKQHNIPFKQHTMVWGSQYPNWITSLSPAEQAAEIEEWIRDYCARYPDTEMIDVVNEATPGHAPADYAASAFGSNWITRSFELVRQYCPNSILILNDYNVLSWNTSEFISMAQPAVNAGVVDAIGLQAHGLADWDINELSAKLDQIAALGLPIYISEYDIEKTNDQEQLAVMREQFPLFYHHPSVAGITLWGYVAGATWRDGTGLIQSNGTARPAMTWLMDYLSR